MVRIVVKVEGDFHSRVSGFAKERHWTIATVTRQALERFMAEETTEKRARKHG